ncbi:polysaccharide deacetylase family protein [Zeaxanthinibacter enoshimensis]|uniref:polysaccharide deacetylase family protein n=1 Tax=Zeaxanthinibacter enoshimensis TaxID=392009 RepID=UPI0035648B57
MLLIYTHKITPRFSYTMKQVFTRILGIEVSFTTKVEDFIKHAGPKITYTKKPLQNEFFVRSNDLLFEQGINDFQIKPEDWDGVPCFFKAGERSNLPYDVFSASFFLLSRYEEYLPHLKDIHGRFPPSESVSFQHNFLHLPVVDIWARKIHKALKERFPELESKERKYQHTSIIDVTTSHSYAHRGLIRSIAGFFLDLGYFRFRRVIQRLSVWMRLRRDPFDNFSALLALHKVHKVKSMFFFQFAEYSTYDKNVSPNNNKFRHLIKSVADYSKVALAASYSSFMDIQLLKAEKMSLSNVIHRPVNYSRLRYNRVDIPVSYRNLVEAEFTDDFTMGYTHEPGFRAGTCTPFYFYDIPLEVQQPIKIHPFAFHDYAFQNMLTEAEILSEMDKLWTEVKNVDGQFNTIFSNELLGGSHQVDWLRLYGKVIKRYHV